MGTLMHSTRSETGDITFIIGSTEIKAHKAVLAAFSPKYMAQFYTNFSVENPIEVKDVSAAAFKEFLQFFYLDTVNLTHKNITDVLTLTAESVEGFFDECVSFLSDTLTVDNVCQCYHLAVKYNNDDLIKKCERKISSDSSKVFLSDTFLSCTAGDLFNILQLDSLNCKETDVFDACILWAVNCGAMNGLDSENVEELRKILTDENLPGQLLHQIRFGAMTIKEFMNYYKNYKQLFTEDERDEILYMIGKVNNFEPKRFNDESRLVPYKEWCEEDSIVCYRTSRANEKESFRFGINETVFSTDRLFLLGGFSCGSLLEKKSNVTENDQQPDEKCVTTSVSLIRKRAIGDKVGKTLFNTTEKLTFKAKEEAFVILHRPVMIKPTFFYEIQLDFKEGFSVRDYEFNTEVILRPKTSQFKTEVILRPNTSHSFSGFGAPVNGFIMKDEERTVVKFCKTNGLVTSLKLNICVK
ncbi:BTB/POZ domain-containing protein 3-like isoform X2 [Bradysia coprophila]|uniref:BTB/POZ domain-containing protein 3-like isoform X2 n=1 Tax=Bradysia coprophila TaxID=38358 RepID=UPI00187DB654|nr:BTB/POZ domain-containing protein 3-like isoform X2 [Bradysia coprophila]